MASTTTSGAAKATDVDHPGFAARIRERDAQALEEVVRRYLPQILRAGSWTRPPLPVDARLYDAEVRRGIDGCLDRVPTNQRMAFVLREIEGMDTQEICKILEVTRTNLGVLLHRVRNHLRECLEAKRIEP